MKIISVAGAQSTIGKTYVACALLKAFPKWAGLKITRCSGDIVCPRGSSCSVCNTLNKDFLIETDHEIINMPNTDTHRMVHAGASKVIWLKTRPNVLAYAIDNTLAYLNKYNGIIIEGNSFLEVHEADLAIMVVKFPLKLKQSAEKIKQKIDIFLINGYDNSDLNKIDEFKNLYPNKTVLLLGKNWVDEIVKRM